MTAFASFRGGARDLAKALQLPKMELLGAAVMNPHIGPMLDRLGFTIEFEPLPETLGALPGEKIEV